MHLGPLKHALDRGMEETSLLLPPEVPCVIGSHECVVLRYLLAAFLIFFDIGRSQVV